MGRIARALFDNEHYTQFGLLPVARTKICKRGELRHLPVESTLSFLMPRKENL